MSLLVIELKVPAGAAIHDSAEPGQALAALTPKFISWVISVLVRGIMWWGRHRAIDRVRRTAGRLAAINMLFLAVVGLIPFAAALSGEYAVFFTSQVVHSVTMLSGRGTHVSALDVCLPASGAMRRSPRLLRNSAPVPGAENTAFMPMMAARPVADRAERWGARPPAAQSTS